MLFQKSADEAKRNQELIDAKRVHCEELLNKFFNQKMEAKEVIEFSVRAKGTVVDSRGGWGLHASEDNGPAIVFRSDSSEVRAEAQELFKDTETTLRPRYRPHDVNQIAIYISDDDALNKLKKLESRLMSKLELKPEAPSSSS